MQYSTTRKKNTAKDMALTLPITFDKLQPFLLYAQYVVYMFVGDAMDAIPHVWKEVSMEEISDWIQCGILSVEQAVTLLLNYYRYVMQESLYSFSTKDQLSRGKHNFCTAIHKFINDIENAVWERHLCECPEFDCNNQDDDSCSNSTEHVINNNLQPPKENIVRNEVHVVDKDVKMNITAVDEHWLLTQAIDEKMEQELLYKINNHVDFM